MMNAELDVPFIIHYSLFIIYHYGSCFICVFGQHLPLADGRSGFPKISR
jgi:hypothetical protein